MQRNDLAAHFARFAGAHKTRTALDMLRQLYPVEKIGVMLNRSNSEVGITVQDVEAALGMPLGLRFHPMAVWL